MTVDLYRSPPLSVDTLWNGALLRPNAGEPRGVVLSDGGIMKGQTSCGVCPETRMGGCWGGVRVCQDVPEADGEGGVTQP